MRQMQTTLCFFICALGDRQAHTGHYHDVVHSIDRLSKNREEEEENEQHSGDVCG